MRQSMKREHPRTLRHKKIGTTPSVGKQMATICWETHGILLINWLPIGMTIKSDRYYETLKDIGAESTGWGKITSLNYKVNNKKTI